MLTELAEAAVEDVSGPAAAPFAAAEDAVDGTPVDRVVAAPNRFQTLGPSVARIDAGGCSSEL
ncbi:MAG: hypothetical protein ACR2G7_03235 [Acidimicrobiales bacterium]